MKLTVSILAAAMAAFCHTASAAPESKGAERFLTAKDAAVAESQKWQATGVAKPILSDDGMVLFPFGQYMPTLTCAPLRTCDIELEPGEEVVSSPKVGDPRFKITKMESGPIDKKVLHLVIKPMEVHLDTNLIIPTDRRVYHIRLKSADKDGGSYIHRAGFYYPEDLVSQWGRSEQKIAEAERARDRLVDDEMAPVSLDKINFNYDISGRSPFRPIRVFSDSVKTWIQLPEEVRGGETPILVVLDENDRPIKVNYRVRRCESGGECADKSVYFLVDYVIKKAMLVLGKDSDLEKVEITRKDVAKRWSFW